MNGCDAMNIGMVMALIKNALTETVTTINSIEVAGNDLIFKTASDTFTITIPEPTLGVDKIEIENKNLKITYNDSAMTVEAGVVNYKVAKCFENLYKALEEQLNNYR